MKKIKILHINSFESEGGAAKAVLRLNNLLNSQIEFESNIYVQKTSDNNSNIISQNNKTYKLFNQIRGTIDSLPTLLYPKRSHLFSNAFLSDSLEKIIIDNNPDIVHLHWINNGFINLKTLTKINRPIVWTLHDSWVFTGGCHVPFDCNKYIDSCGSCPVLGSNKKKDLSYFNLKRKNSIYSKLNISFITPSNWLAQCCKKSKLLNKANISIIKNCIDISKFKPLDKTFARKALNLPLNKKIILFGANGALTDVNKGWDLLNDSLQILSNYKNDILVCVFGALPPKEEESTIYETLFLGKFHDETSLSLIYASADVLVVPSRLENLSNTIIEGMACGIPTVAYNVGGNEDIITHKMDGYLAKPFDSTDFCNGIVWILSNDKYDNISLNCRNKIENFFSFDKISSQITDIYKRIIQI